MAATIIPLLLATLWLAACGRKAPSAAPSILLSSMEIADRLPDRPARDPVRTLENRPEQGVSYIEQNKPLKASRFSPYTTLRLILIEGRMDVRVGGERRTLGPGSYLSIPPYARYRVLRVGKDPLRYVLFRTPNISKDQVFEEGRGLNSIPDDTPEP